MELILAELAKRLAFSLPFIAIWIAGIIFCVQYRKNSSRETTLFIVAFVIMIIHTLAANIVQAWLIFNIDEYSRASTGVIFSIMGFVSVAINSICWIMILIGIHQLLQNKNSLQQTQ
jgi:hypothetical protein